MKKEVAVLIADVVNGTEISKKRTELLCEKKSVSQSEHYAAIMVGLRVQKVLVFDSDDFRMSSSETNDPSEVEHDGEIYKIVRTYEKGKNIEVVCT